MSQVHPEEIWERVACNLCGADDGRVRITPSVTDFDPHEVLSASGGIRGTQQIVQCRRCGLMYVNPRLRGTLVVDAYSSAVDDLYAEAGEGRMATFRRGVKLLEQYSPGRGKLLDVGSACGFFVRAALDAGWEAEGVDPSRWSAEYGRSELGVNIFPGVLREAHYPDQHFDAVTAWDVLEHVPDPLAELNEIRRILRPGGVLLVNYPNAGSLMARMAGRHWWFYLSVHLYYFTPRTLGQLLEKAGFEVHAHRRHIQKLPLGHLIKVASIYVGGAAKALHRAATAMRVADLTLPYYAAQANVIALRTSGGREP